MNISKIMDIMNDPGETEPKRYRQVKSFYTAWGHVPKLCVRAIPSNYILQLLEKCGMVKHSKRNGNVQSIFPFLSIEAIFPRLACTIRAITDRQLKLFLQNNTLFLKGTSHENN